MNELKSVYIDRTGDWVRSETNTGKFYLKSETDKVIAELEESHKKDVEQLLIEIAELKDKLDLYKRGWEENDKINANLYAQLRHQKRKRCMAMANWCDDAARLATWDTDYHRCGWYNKWMKRWLELALKFELKNGVNNA